MAMVFEGAQRPFVCHRIGLPPLDSGEVLVQVDYATICSSDLHTYYGRRHGPMPCILGHEIVGSVVALGSGGVNAHSGTPLRVGDAVTWAVYAYDPEGEMAKRGLPQKSAGLFKYGHQAFDGDRALSGGFATHCHLKRGTPIFRLPPSLHLVEAAPLNCTHATIAGALRLAGALTGKNVLVIGAGMLGLSACAMTREAGARRVWAMDTDAERRRAAPDFGADTSLLPTVAADRLQGAGGVDVVIETSGAPPAMERGLELLNTGGIAVWVGAVYAQRNLALNAEAVVRKVLTIRGLHNYTPEDLASAIRFLTAHRHRYPFRRLVGPQFSLTDLDRAFEAAAARSCYRVGVRPPAD